MNGKAIDADPKRRQSDVQPANGRVVVRVTIYESVDPALYEQIKKMGSPFEKSAFVSRALFALERM